MSATEEAARYGTDSPYPPITAVQSRQNEPLTVMYDSSGDGAWKALGFVIDRVTRRTVNIPDFATGLADGDTLNFGYFGENGYETNTSNPGDDRLRIGDKQERRLHEFGVSVTPQDEDLLVGVETPSDATVTAVEDDRTRGFDGTALRDFGGVGASFTETSEGVPTTALSPDPGQGLVRVDSEDDGENKMRFAFANETGGQVDLSARVRGAAYEVSIVRDRDVVADLLYDGRVRTLTWGGQGNNAPRLPTEWETAVVNLSPEDSLEAVRPE